MTGTHQGSPDRHHRSVPHPDTLSRILGFIGVGLVVILVLFTFGILTSDRSTSLTIASGPRLGPSWQVAQEIAESLQGIGYEVTIVSRDNTLTLIDQVDDPTDEVDIAFLYSTVDAREFPNVSSLGTVGKRPIIFLATRADSAIRSVAEMKGARIDVGPANSAMEQIVTEVLALYGVDETNSTLVNMPSTATLADYRANNLDVITERYGDSRPVLDALINDDSLRLIPIDENVAVAGLIRSAQPMSIPRGGLSLNPVIPKVSLPTIGQTLTVITRSNLSPSAAYAVSRSLVQAFGDSTMFSTAGEYPNFADRQLPINPTAAEFYQTSQIPWQYQHLPPILADSLLQLIIPLSLLVLFSSLYSMFLPEMYSLWRGVIKPRTEERLVSAMEARLADGRELTVRQRQRLSDILSQQDAGRAIRQRVEAMRTELSDPVQADQDHQDDRASQDR